MHCVQDKLVNATIMTRGNWHFRVRCSPPTLTGDAASPDTPLDWAKHVDYTSNYGALFQPAKVTGIISIIQVSFAWLSDKPHYNTIQIILI